MLLFRIIDQSTKFAEIARESARKVTKAHDHCHVQFMTDTFMKQFSYLHRIKSNHLHANVSLTEALIEAWP